MNNRGTLYQIESRPLPGTDRVFAGTRTRDQKPVIVKRLRSRHAGAAAVLRHEFTVLEQLRDAPVAHALDFITERGSCALVLEPARGEASSAILARGVPDLKRFVALALAASKTLAEVHRRGFVHRDIKPDHFFIDERRGLATLIDFGLTTALPRERHLPVEIDRLEGTLPYISPEQTGRMNHSVDRRSDLYSLGVTLYELCTGKLPFASDDALELVHAHIAKLPAAPRSHRPDLPEVLEKIILRLLAKSPDQRFQTALGLVADLERIHAELSSSGSVSSFDLGRNDHDGELHLPEKLYGRAGQIQTLLDSVGRAQKGARELTLIAGPPGVGKSALVHEIHRELLREGHFVSGKFDQYNRGVPYSALSSACGELVRVFLASPRPKLEAWKSRLATLLGENVGVVVEVVPELALALGEAPDVLPLPPHEAQLRFERTFRRFMEASAREGSPLVLFIDDLQWADSASLAALELVLSSESQGHLLVIGNYRDAEIDAAHPLSRCIERLGRSLPIQRIELGPLLPSDVLALVSDALPLSKQDPGPLARLIADKTSGNPFFVGQFLERLAAEGQLAFEPGRGFSWDLDAIAALGATDNVVELVVRRLGVLDPRTQELLRLAACVGHTFRLRVLSVIAESTRAEVARGLSSAVTGGYLSALDRNHHILEELLAAESGDEVDAGYRFVHDRVQQAALSRLDAAERGRVHLRIGRLLLSSTGDAGPSNEQLFEITAHLNLGRASIDDPAERQVLARLNLRTAARAKSAAAHASVIELASTCLELLGPEPFEADHATSLAAHLLLVEAHYLSNDGTRALELIASIERHARSVLERVPARNLKTTLLTHQGQLEVACDVSIQTLALLGSSLPDPHDQAALGQAIGEAFGAYQAALGAREVASLRHLPPMTQPENLALVNTMAGIIPAAFQSNSSLMVLLVLSAVRRTLEHGTAPISPFFYVLYGVTHNAITSDYARSHEFGLLALELARRPEHAAARAAVEFIYAAFVAPWVRPASESQAHFEQAMIAGPDVGDQVHAAYAMSFGQCYRLYAGEELSEIERPMLGYMKVLASQGDVFNQLYLTTVERSIACLRGETQAPGSMDGAGFSEAAFEAQAPPAVAALYAANKAMLRYLFGDAEGARRAVEASVPVPGALYGAEYAFYHGMGCVELSLAAEPGERQELLAAADGDLAKLAQWARACSHNFSALHQLLRAELHAARGEALEALDAYEAAIERATDATAIHHLALAHERAGRFHLRSGRKRLAHLGLSEASDHYERWGARGLVARLRQQFPEAVRPAAFANEPAVRAATLTRNMATRSGDGGSRLDLTSAMRAVEAIASELRLEPLLRRLLQILVENAGATRGVLVLSDDGRLEVRALLRVEPETISVDLAEAVESSRLLPSSIVQYCARTVEPIVIQDATRDRRFARDPFVREHQCKSITCLPLVHQGKLVGVLYLENDSATGAFHAARVERLEFLGGHAAVALQNARLYEQIEAANASLERRVRERTAELSDRNRDMRRVLDNVAQGLITIDLQGRLSSERSRTVDQWFGGFEPGALFAEYVARIDRRFEETFSFTFELLLEGVLPEALAISQLPGALQYGARQFELSYQPIHVADQLSGLLIVMDDVTEALRRARDEAEQKEELTLCRRFWRDRSGLLGFFEEAEGLVGQLARSGEARESVKQGLHTLKGNAAMLGFSLLADQCHKAEDAIGEGRIASAQIESVIERFSTLRKTLASIAGDHASERVDVSRDALHSLAVRLEAGLSSSEASRAIERLLLEPLAVPLERLGEHARILCGRLGKGELVVEVADGGLFGDAQQGARLFAALVHLVRNAVDHGFETAPERAARGKGPPVLTFSAGVVAGEVYIEIKDNGRGVDWDRVRVLADARGLPSASREALVDALFAPDVSTRTVVTATSGRGVGLAAVRTEVELRGGRVEVDSERGRGSVFRVCLPQNALGIQGSAPENKRRPSVPHAAAQRPFAR